VSEAVALLRMGSETYIRSFWTLTGSLTLLRQPTMLALAEKASCSPEQVFFRLAQDMGITPLAGSQNEQHMKDGVRVEILPELDPNLSAQILEVIS
jgi:diketogulonate reductase-like aldo/keto reductase